VGAVVVTLYRAVRKVLRIMYGYMGLLQAGVMCNCCRIVYCELVLVDSVVYSFHACRFTVRISYSKPIFSQRSSNCAFVGCAEPTSLKTAPIGPCIYETK
jgi:hypothetical protein